jgi:hypothetical protein
MPFVITGTKETAGGGASRCEYEEKCENSLLLSSLKSYDRFLPFRSKPLDTRQQTIGPVVVRCE